VSRVVRRSHAQSANEAKELLSAVLAAELVLPSTCLWLRAPSVSDLELLDNSAGTFAGLSRFGRRGIRLAEILGALAESGSSVVVVTGSGERSRVFRRRLELVSQDLRVSDRVRLELDGTEQARARTLVGDDFALVGGMDLTYGGVELREEQVELRTDPPYVTEARTEMLDRFGGAPW
jgi:hypothetical protein